MAFNDRYAITDFNSDLKQRISLSVDEVNDQICPVILLVPDLDQADHDHIFVGTAEINELRIFLTTKGHSIFFSGHYCLKIVNFSLKSKTVEMEVLMKDHENLNFKKQYSMTLPMETLDQMRNWLDQFQKLTPEELWRRYNADCKGKK